MSLGLANKEKTGEVVIRVENLYKSFRIPHEKHNNLKSVIINILKSRSYTEHHAARGISFDVMKGEFLGIIGRNGCGKSTMLKMLAGIYLPDKGRITVNGRLSPFLELGVGFNPELTARDNVYLNGAMLGLSRKEIDEKFDEIISFAELEEFVDQRLKNFSSGMQVRLAFSVAIQAHAEVLLIDEVLAVGDANFQAKCNKVFHRLKKEGKTIVFVTHSMAAVSEYCDRVILLKDGKIFKEGAPKDVVGDYERLNFDGNSSDDTDKASWGNNLVTIKKIEYLSENKKGMAISCNVPFVIKLTIKNNNKDTQRVGFGLEIFKADGTKCATIPYRDGGDNRFFIKGNKTALMDLSLDTNYLLPGSYYFDYRLFGTDLNDVYEACSYASKFEIVGISDTTGIVDFNPKWKIL